MVNGQKKVGFQSGDKESEFFEKTKQVGLHHSQSA